jgi:hypothetical protein
MASDQGQAEGDHMGADDAPLHAVAAGTFVIAGAIRQHAGAAVDGAIAEGEHAADDRRLKGDLLHRAALEQGLGIPEHRRAGPIHQHFLRERNSH